MNTLIAIATAVLVCYTLTLCVINRGVPRSLSMTVFNLPAAGSWLWTAVIGFVAFCFMPVLIEKVSEETKFLAFIACAGLMLVAVCPLVKDKTDFAYKAHMVGAYTAAVASQMLIALNRPWLLLCWVPWIIAYYSIMKGGKCDTRVFWAEMICIFIIVILVMVL